MLMLLFHYYCCCCGCGVVAAATAGLEVHFTKRHYNYFYNNQYYKKIL